MSRYILQCFSHSRSRPQVCTNVTFIQSSIDSIQSKLFHPVICLSECQHVSETQAVSYWPLPNRSCLSLDCSTAADHVDASKSLLPRTCRSHAIRVRCSRPTTRGLLNIHLPCVLSRSLARSVIDVLFSALMQSPSRSSRRQSCYHVRMLIPPRIANDVVVCHQHRRLESLLRFSRSSVLYLDRHLPTTHPAIPPSAAFLPSQGTPSSRPCLATYLASINDAAFPKHGRLVVVVDVEACEEYLVLGVRQRTLRSPTSSSAFASSLPPPAVITRAYTKSLLGLCWRLVADIHQRPEGRIVQVVDMKVDLSPRNVIAQYLDLSSPRQFTPNQATKRPRTLSPHLERWIYNRSSIKHRWIPQLDAWKEAAPVEHERRRKGRHHRRLELAASSLVELGIIPKHEAELVAGTDREHAVGHGLKHLLGTPVCTMHRAQCSNFTLPYAGNPMHLLVHQLHSTHVGRLRVLVIVGELTKRSTIDADHNVRRRQQRIVDFKLLHILIA